METKAPGCLYGIGVGPGDSRLMTLRAVELLGRLTTVFVPRSREKAASLAWEIAGRHIGADCRIVTLDFPMTKSAQELQKRWEEAAAQVAKTTGRGEDCGFLTVGDPMFFSTFIYLQRALRRLAPAVRIERVPGISAAFAAASRSGLPLAEADDSVAIIPGDRAAELESLLRGFQTIVIMKVGKRLPWIMSIVKELGLEGRTVIAHRIGLENETIVEGADFSGDQRVGYFSTVIVKAANHS
jgi:precorrin-2/cobalt-factor-2 C20-methyltransferase